MPFGRSAMLEKLHFVELAAKPGANIRELCRRFDISPTTGYQLLRRYVEEGEAGLAERSRRPVNSPTKTDEAMEKLILELRAETHWGARKIAKVLSTELRTDVKRSTTHSVLERNGAVALADSQKHTAWKRFEHERPNDLWQMDFMGPVA